MGQKPAERSFVCRVLVCSRFWLVFAVRGSGGGRVLVFSHISAGQSFALFFVAVTEEVIGRGFILGRMLDGGINKFVALFISAVLFSLMHLFNPNFAFVPFLNIMLAGCFLGGLPIYIRVTSVSPLPCIGSGTGFKVPFWDIKSVEMNSAMRIC